MSRMNIYERLSECRKGVDYLQKDRDVSTGGGSYKALSHDMVTAHLRTEYIKHGVLVVPRVLERKVVDAGATAKGTPIVRYEGTFAIWFVAIDDPEDKVDVVLDAHALDQGDKSPGKALSYAVKYAMLKIHNIETGEDDESRIGEPEDKAAKVAAKRDATLDEWAQKLKDAADMRDYSATMNNMPTVLRAPLKALAAETKARLSKPQ